MNSSDLGTLFKLPGGKPVDLSTLDADCADRIPFSKEEAVDMLSRGVERLKQLQEKLWADDRWSLLVIFQAMDAAGKDGCIKHVMSGVNPQGCHVVPFKAPSAEEIDHDFLWRASKALPERGRIGIFNRSYYEELLVVRVHPDILGRQKLPSALVGPGIWKERFEDINGFERYLSRQGVRIIKIFLNISRKEQKKRFLERLTTPEKQWKFSSQDVAERRHWIDYIRAYEDLLPNTSTSWAPWHVVPADQKWLARLIVAEILICELESLDLKWPEVSVQEREALKRAEAELRAEKD